MSEINSLTQNSGVYIDKIIRPFVEALPSFVDTTDVLRQIDGVCIEPTALLASLDIEALYSSIAYDAGLKAVDYFLKQRGNTFSGHNLFINPLLSFVLTLEMSEHARISQLLERASLFSSK